MNPIHGSWVATSVLVRRFTCGYCGVATGTPSGLRSDVTQGAFIYFCGACNRPTFFDRDGSQSPVPKLGQPIQNLPSQGNVATLYEELRLATSAGANTGAVLVARSLLAEIAVNKGAKLGERFAFYVDYLEKQGFTSPSMKPWVDHIRDQANISAHELKPMGADEGRRSLKFAEMLLRIVYEFPADVPTP